MFYEFGLCVSHKLNFSLSHSNFAFALKLREIRLKCNLQHALVVTREQKREANDSLCAVGLFSHTCNADIIINGFILAKCHPKQTLCVFAMLCARNNIANDLLVNAAVSLKFRCN